MARHEKNEKKQKRCGKRKFVHQSFEKRVYNERVKRHKPTSILPNNAIIGPLCFQIKEFNKAPGIEKSVARRF